MAEENKQKKIIDQLDQAFKDMVKAAFGDKGLEFVEQVQKQSKEFSAGAVKSFVEFTDKVLESMKLNENELVKKSSDNVKDLLRQLGLLEEAKEDDF
jgi:polyhydroxyalkanoate synthesis regulator protein